METLAGWENAVYAIPYGPFLSTLSKSVTNSGDKDSTAKWILTQVIQWANVRGESYSPIDAYDAIIETIEEFDIVWPAFEMMANLFEDSDSTKEVLPDLARFIFERIPAVMKEVEQGHYLKRSIHEPVGRALVIAERVHDLVGLFSAGLKPNGSKDPFALRRSAKHFLWCVLPGLPVR